MPPDGFPPHRFGYRPDSPDRRDRLLYASVPNIDALPAKADNSKILPPPMDQGATSSCTGFSGANTIYSVFKMDGHKRPFVPSPVFLYRQARDLGGYVEEDGGTEIRLVWKAAAKLGVPPISGLKPRFEARDLADPKTGLFPESSIWRRPPSKSLLAAAETRQMLTYFRLPTLNDMVKCLADGWCANLGFTVFRSFYGDHGPVYDVPDPVPGERDLGGHAVTLWGYDKAARRFLLRNQWGATAHEGRPDFTLSWDYVDKYAGDVWTGRLAEGGKVAA